jgi:hypothetical protein
MSLKVKLSKEEMVEFLNSPEIVEVFGLLIDGYVIESGTSIEKVTEEVELSLNGSGSIKNNKYNNKVSFKNTSNKIDSYLQQKNKQPLEYAA